MGETKLFFYDINGVECEAKDSCLISETKLPEPDPNLRYDIVRSSSSRSLHGCDILVGDVVDFMFGVPPRVILKCRRTYISPIPFNIQWIRGLNEAACNKVTFIYQKRRLWVNVVHACHV